MVNNELPCLLLTKKKKKKSERAVWEELGFEADGE